LRSVIFRYRDIAALSAALSETRGSLPLPEGESVGDGEWVLAIFELGSKKRATAAAARGVRAAGDTHLEFERRDWDRLNVFVAARSESLRAARPAGGLSSARVPVAKESVPILNNNSPGSPSSAKMKSGIPGSPASDLPPLPPPPPASLRGPASRRLDDIPPSSALESSRIPFGSRVLVIDDDAGAGDELRAMLGEMGLIAEVASTAKRAAERMNEVTFDAIVLDLHTRGMDSREFVVRLRADAKISDLPVLFLSSRPTSRDVVDAFASGGDDFLPKPFRTPELAARIFGLLRRARIARAVAQSGGSSGGGR
jgi:two-component system, OmpR family, phosphate regulon response regulator PhoB